MESSEKKSDNINNNNSSPGRNISPNTNNEIHQNSNTIPGSHISSTNTQNTPNPSNTSNISNTNTLSEDNKNINFQIEFDVKKFLEEINPENIKAMTSTAQLKRLLNSNFYTPYEVLMLTPEATDEEIKRQYRQLSMLVHPDKCSDSQAPDAFHGKDIYFNFYIN